MLAKKIIVSFIFLFFVLQSKTFAQQTIFNVPSADVLEKGQVFLQHESQFSGDFGLFTDYASLGVGKYTELDLTLFGVGTRKVRNEILGVGFKTALPIHKKSETKLTFGNIIPVSLRGDGVGGYAYSHLSTVLPKLRTRLTSGLLVGTTTLFGRDFVCYIAGLEQPITKRLSIIMDYHSGKHANGFLIPGFSYDLGKDIFLWAGYQIPNNRANGDNGFVIELSKIFLR